MADIHPFRALRYAGADHLADVLTPPYDVITPEAQAAYHARSPYNIIRLELGQDAPGDDQLQNRYTRAAATFAEWRRSGIMQQDPSPAFYIYQQTFTVLGREYTRASVLARVRLEPWEAGVILPHEHTLAKPKSDRLRLLRATTANLSPIMALFEDPRKATGKILAKATKGAPLMACTDDQGEGHAIWRLDDEAMIAKLQSTLAPAHVFIADGHHRYETALAFRDEVRELQRGLLPEEAANFVLMALVPMSDPGLVILPTHRLVQGIGAATLKSLPKRLAALWDVQDLAAASVEDLLAELAAVAEPAALAATKDHRWLLTMTPAGATRMAETGEPDAWQRLDVAAAQELILGEALGIAREAIASGDQVRYIRDAAEALAAVESGAAEVAILLNPTRAEQLRDVAKVGGRMPQKSTYFYPKLISGMVINPVW